MKPVICRFLDHSIVDELPGNYMMSLSRITRHQF